ncbi:MAG: hypothetical protein IPP76_11735 [Moraxellaceae bacterium]|nr:hypothetical protein [Moraxellaceae bacterium]
MDASVGDRDFLTFLRRVSIENRLLATKIRLERLLMIFLIISYRILQMTMLSRIVPEQSCELLFSREEWRVAYQVRYRKKATN